MGDSDSLVRWRDPAVFAYVSLLGVVVVAIVAPLAAVGLAAGLRASAHVITALKQQKEPL